MAKEPSKRQRRRPGRAGKTRRPVVETAIVLSAIPAAMRVGNDRDLASLLALAGKVQRGESDTVTQQELAALRRIEKIPQDAALDLLAAELPKKYWVQWSGRPHKVLAEQAERYDIPLAGATISVKAVARWIHDFLAEHGARLCNGTGDAELDSLMVGRETPARRRLLRVQAEIRELELARMRGTLMSREAVHALHVRMAEVLRKAGEQIKRQFGEGAHEVLAAALEGLEREMVAAMPGEPGGSDVAM